MCVSELIFLCHVTNNSKSHGCLLLHLKALSGDNKACGVLLHLKALSGDNKACGVLLHLKALSGDNKACGGLFFL